MKFTKKTATEQIQELNIKDIDESDTSKSFKNLCRYFLDDKLSIIHDMDSLVPTEYEKLCVEKLGYRLSLDDMLQELHEILYSLKDLFLPTLIDDFLCGDDMINAIWKLYYEHILPGKK